MPLTFCFHTGITVKSLSVFPALLSVSISSPCLDGRADRCIPCGLGSNKPHPIHPISHRSGPGSLHGHPRLRILVILSVSGENLNFRNPTVLKVWPHTIKHAHKHTHKDANLQHTKEQIICSSSVSLNLASDNFLQ